MFIVMLAVLLSGALGMETADEANSSKRKRNIGRAGTSPALPPNSNESPGGGVYTPGGSNLFRMEREVGRGNRREKVTLFGKPGDTSPEQTKHYNRLNDLDTKRRCIPLMSSPMFYNFQPPCFLQ